MPKREKKRGGYCKGERGKSLRNERVRREVIEVQELQEFRQ
jgi:hypothetical protein